MDPRQIVGKTVAHYKILEDLGSGGMANVYKALDVQLDRTVVLKILDADLLGDDSARRRFLREARLASSLDHPNICTIYEIHDDNGVYYIAMQYVEGQTLKRTINGHPLAAPTLLSIGLQVADAVAMAHDRGIIHRDIKPQNIMITPRGQAKVLDFGLGKNLEESSSHAGAELTVLGSPFGTPSYMSPEQARGDRTDRRADVFSFGIVLYEMATGKKPFVGKNHVDIYYAICNETPPPVDDFNLKAPERLQSIIDRAMAKDPADRYQSMHELLDELKQLSVNMQMSSPVPDGINQPYAPIQSERASWAEKFLPGPLKRLFAHQQPQPPHARESLILPPVEAPKPAGRVLAPVDDFPLLPGLHKSLAVLPFRSLGGDVANELSFSVLEALVAELAQFKSLTVRPISSVTKYADRMINPTDVGRELGADAVLAGSMLRSDSKLRVTAQLIETRTGGVLWAGKVDAHDAGVMEVLDSVCSDIIEGLAGKHLPTDMLDLLNDESEEIRLDGVSMLMYSHDPRAVDALASALSDESPRVKAAAAEAISRFGREAAPAVTAQIEDASERSDFATARFAVKAAGLIGSSEVLSPLLESLIADDSMLASEAAIALGRLGDPRARPDLVDALQRNDANVRFTSAQALGLLGDWRAIESLEECAREDEDEGVRAKAQWAISHIQRTSQASRSVSGESISEKSLARRSGNLR